MPFRSDRFGPGLSGLICIPDRAAFPSETLIWSGRSGFRTLAGVRVRAPERAHACPPARARARRARFPDLCVKGGRP